MSWSNQTKDSSSWTNGTEHTSAFSNKSVSLETGMLLLENGSNLLLETGFKILLEQLFAPIWSNQTQH